MHGGLLRHYIHLFAIDGAIEEKGSDLPGNRAGGACFICCQFYCLSVVHSAFILFDSFCSTIQCSIILYSVYFFCSDTGNVFQVF